MDENTEMTGASGLEKKGGLEKNIGPGSSIVDSQTAKVVNEFGDLVCLVMHAPSRGFNAVGTGFLIGPRHVLTNYHVVEGVEAKNLRCRFDVVSSGNNEFEVGPLIAVNKIVAESRYSEIEASGQYSRYSSAQPELGELDYAVLEVDTFVQKMSIRDDRSGKQKRDWLPLPSMRPTIEGGAKIYILQHPKGKTLQLASDPITNDQPPNGSRLRYLADTEDGSSGSPCFAFTEGPDKKSRLMLVALHNFGDPGSRLKKSEFNQGVPVELIHKSLTDAGIPKVVFAKAVPNSRYRPWLKLVSAVAATAAIVAVAIWYWTDPSPVPETDPIEDIPDLLSETIPYDPNFLGKVSVPLPTLVSAAAAGDYLDGKVFDYVHYSLVMDERRAMPLYVAYNTDRQTFTPVKREKGRLAKG